MTGRETLHRWNTPTYPSKISGWETAVMFYATVLLVELVVALVMVVSR
jgi:hypothetical protein